MVPSDPTRMPVDIQRHVHRNQPSTADGSLLGEPSSRTDDSTLENLLSLLNDKTTTMWHDLVQKEFAMLFDFVCSSVHNMVPALKLAIGVTLDVLATETEQGKATPLPLSKPDLAAEEKRFKAFLQPALDEYADGKIDSAQLDTRRADARRRAAVPPTCLALHVIRKAYDADADGDIDEEDAKLGNAKASDVIETLKYDIGAARLVDHAKLPLPPALQGVDPGCIVQVENLVHIEVKFGRQPYVFYVKTRKPCTVPLLGVEVRFYQADYTAHTWLVHNGQKVTKMYMAILEDRPFELECDIDVFMGSCMVPEAVEQRIAVSLLRTLLKKTFDPHAPMEFNLDETERPSSSRAPSSMEFAPGLCASPRKHAASRNRTC